jgi:hypothetical protein
MGWFSKGQAAILKHDGVSCAEAVRTLRSKGYTWGKIVKETQAKVEESKKVIEQCMSDVYESSTKAGAPSKERVIEHNRSSIKWNKGIIKCATAEAKEGAWGPRNRVKAAWNNKEADPKEYEAAKKEALDHNVIHIWIWTETIRGYGKAGTQRRLNLETCEYEGEM